MIPFYKMNNLNEPVMEELINCAADIIKSGNFVFGTDKFEEEFADYNGSKYCVALSSGTSALHVALLALGIKEGDEVITVSHTFRATVSAIRYCGATPVFVDIDPKTYVMDVEQVENKITNKTKAIVPVHLYGNMVDMFKLKIIAEKYNLPIVEDCSQSHGSTINGVKSGTIGNVGTFSFYPGKGLGALGDAGCIVTDDDYIYEFAKKIRSWDDNTIGYNYRMSNLQAEFLRIKLKVYNDILEEKKQIAKYYDDNLIKSFCFVNSNVEHSYHVYPIIVSKRKQFVEKISNMVETKTHYDRPVHKYFSHMQGASLPITEKIARTELSLPIYPGLDYKKVVEIINDNISTFL